MCVGAALIAGAVLAQGCASGGNPAPAGDIGAVRLRSACEELRGDKPWAGYVGMAGKFDGVRLVEKSERDDSKERAYRLEFTFPPGSGIESRVRDVVFSTRGSGEVEPMGGHGRTALLEHVSFEDRSEFVLHEGTVYIRSVDPIKDRKWFIPRPWPVLITRYIGVGAEGTEFIVQTNAGTEESPIERVFLGDAGGTLVAAPLRSDEPVYKLKSAGCFLEYKEGQMTVRSLDDDQGAKDFRDEMLARAREMVNALGSPQAPTP